MAGMLADAPPLAIKSPVRSLHFRLQKTPYTLPKYRMKELTFSALRDADTSQIHKNLKDVPSADYEHHGREKPSLD
jgi:hypothetical protein